MYFKFFNSSISKSVEHVHDIDISNLIYVILIFK